MKVRQPLDRVPRTPLFPVGESRASGVESVVPPRINSLREVAFRVEGGGSGLRRGELSWNFSFDETLMPAVAYASLPNA